MEPHNQWHFHAYNGNKFDAPFLIEVFVRQKMDWPPFFTHSFDVLQAIQKSKSRSILDLKKKCDSRANNLKLSTVYAVLFEGETFDHHNAEADVAALKRISEHPTIAALVKNKAGYVDIQVLYAAQSKRQAVRINKLVGTNREKFEKDSGWVYENVTLGDGTHIPGTASVEDEPKYERPIPPDPSQSFSGEPEGPSDTARACTTLMSLFFLFLPIHLLQGW